uniref:NUC129 domain-containing protein n=1 Tax=Globodera pallida TaxID=36090 RepID=A0A183BQZ4_GLOPA
MDSDDKTTTRRRGKKASKTTKPTKRAKKASETTKPAKKSTSKTQTVKKTTDTAAEFSDLSSSDTSAEFSDLSSFSDESLPSKEKISTRYARLLEKKEKKGNSSYNKPSAQCGTESSRTDDSEPPPQ